jgi:hypothetical protein
VSLSVSPDGTEAVYNSIEGLTSLWDLTTGDIKAKYESYRSGDEPEAGEPITGLYERLDLIIFELSLVCLSESQ